MSQHERDILKTMQPVLTGRRTVAEAARLLRLDVRQVRRIRRRLAAEGDAGVVHRRDGVRHRLHDLGAAEEPVKVRQHQQGRGILGRQRPQRPQGRQRIRPSRRRARIGPGGSDPPGAAPASAPTRSPRSTSQVANRHDRSRHKPAISDRASSCSNDWIHKPVKHASTCSANCCESVIRPPV